MEMRRQEITTVDKDLTSNKLLLPPTITTEIHTHTHTQSKREHAQKGGCWHEVGNLPLLLMKLKKNIFGMQKALLLELPGHPHSFWFIFFLVSCWQPCVFKNIWIRYEPEKQEQRTDGFPAKTIRLNS